MTSTDLVGPPARPPLTFDIPREAGDPRFAACLADRPAGEGREAVVGEERIEARREIEEVRRAFERTLAGHATYDLGAGGIEDFALESHRVCPCTGCQIARSLYRAYSPLRTPMDQLRDIERARS